MSVEDDIIEQVGTQVTQLQDKVKHLEAYLASVTETVKAYIAGEPLSMDRTYIERLLCEYREKVNEGRAAIFAASGKKMPPLTVSYGSSGLEIRALLDKSFNCAEFRTDERKPQQVLVAPWIQFEPADLSDERLRIVMEIARRAMAYDAMVERVASMERLVESWRDAGDRNQEEKNKLVELWRAERVAAGKPADFSDIDWEKQQ